MPPDQPSMPRYSLTAIVFHWFLAVAIIGMFFFGLYMVSLPFSPQKLKYMNWHKWAGMIILFLSVARLITRLIKRPPPLPPKVLGEMPRWQRIAHHATHHSMYLLFFLVPLLGWAYSSAAGFPIVLFGHLPLPDLLPVDPALAQTIKPWHKIAAYALMAFIVLHVAAVLKHQFINRDGLLRRMLPGRRSVRV